MIPIAYLACPFSDPSSAICDLRFKAANYAAGVLMQQGEVIFSPLSHSYPIAQAINAPTLWDFWKPQDEAILRRCTKLYVLCIDGWLRSVGVREEVEIAHEMGIPITYLSYWEFNLGYYGHLPDRPAPTPAPATSSKIPIALHIGNTENDG